MDMVVREVPQVGMGGVVCSLKSRGVGVGMSFVFVELCSLSLFWFSTFFVLYTFPFVLVSFLFIVFYLLYPLLHRIQVLSLPQHTILASHYLYALYSYDHVLSFRSHSYSAIHINS